MVTAAGESVTEVFKDPAGTTIATLKINVVVGEGGVNETEVLSCDGQTYETLAFCLSPDSGAGGTRGGGGSSGGVLCSLGTCM